MIWIKGRFSWPLVIAIAYCTFVIVATDIAWRLIQAPMAWIAGGGMAVILAGAALIILLGSRATQR